MSEEVLKDLCMEWYLQYGERETDDIKVYERVRHSKLWGGSKYIWWTDVWGTGVGIKLTPKALKIIKGG